MWAVVLGLACGGLGALRERSPTAGIPYGAVGLAVFLSAFAIGCRRFGRRVADAVEAQPTPRRAVLVAYRRSRQWLASFVCDGAGAEPLTVQLAAAPPRRWRDRPTLVAVHGQTWTGGLVAVVFPDGSKALAYRPAQRSVWPPRSPQAHSGSRPR